MAPNSQSPGDYDSPSSQIPLQDLSRHDDPADERGRRSADNAGTGIFSRPSMMRMRPRSQYQSVAADSPIDAPPANRNLSPQPTDAREEDIAHHDLGQLAQAMSFGISFDEPYSRFSAAGLSANHDFNDSASDHLDNVPLDTYQSHDPDHYAPYPPATDEEDARLTDPRWLQPISGTAASEGRPSSDNPAGSSRLGDDLPHIEEGLGRGRGSSARSRSLSPSTGGALHRASSMVKSMSQRVVNLSNEPEVVQQSIEREESDKNARMDGPPVLPAMVDFGLESSAQARREKPSPSSMAWKHLNNPFRGRSLGIVGPNHPLRLWLCDILVHPFMEPFVLLIIIIQTILLIVESSKSVFSKPIAARWSATPLDWVFLIIFIFYTLEICAKILVSGFVFNPTEYSTLNRSLSIGKAIAEKGRNLITPHRQATTKKVSFLPSEPQSSIIRTFTGLNALDTPTYDDPLQKRRIRLAHRAFLRHSFNRLDFVAIVAFWISFFLSMEGVEKAHQLFIFKMLSCLRILRLLALTNGTSVRRSPAMQPHC